MQATVAAGQTFSIGRYTLRFDGLTSDDDPHVAITRADVAVLRDGRLVARLAPEKR